MNWLDEIEKQIREDKALAGDKGFFPKDMVRLSTTLRLLVEVGKKAKIAEDTLEAVVDSFPDGNPPHPTIEECMNAYQDISIARRAAFADPDCRELLEVDDANV